MSFEKIDKTEQDLHNAGDQCGKGNTRCTEFRSAEEPENKHGVQKYIEEQGAATDQSACFGSFHAF